MYEGQVVRTRIIRFLTISVLSFAFAGCGGGGGGGMAATPPPPPPPPPSGFQPGVFMPASTFAAKCVAPRAGIDPATGQPFPDIAGTTLDENNFLRSFSDDTYLWFDEITDQDPAGFNDPLDYFDQLKTFATTNSGADRDKFHFTFDSLDWFNLSQGGVSVGYGAEFVLLSAVVPRDVVVAFTEPNSPATNLALPLARGAKVLTIDGVDINDNTQAGVDALNAGLFPSAADPQHTFEILSRLPDEPHGDADRDFHQLDAGAERAGPQHHHR